MTSQLTLENTKYSGTCAHGIFSNANEIFQSLIVVLLCCVTKSEGQISYLSLESTANQRQTNLWAEPSRPVLMLLQYGIPGEMAE